MIQGRRSLSGAAARAAAALLLAAALLAAAGCSTYTERNKLLRAELSAGRFDKALTGIDEAAQGHDRLLNLLEKGLVLHYADRWAESNATFEEAEQLAADLYTRSVSQAALSLVTNDNAIDYRAAPFEMALVPYYRALNYVYLKQPEDAVVEARKAELQLREYAEVAAALREGDDDGGDADAALDNDAFLQYLRGMLLDWGGEANEAFIAYRQAAAAYSDAAGRLDVETPPWLGADLLRTGTALGFSDVLDEIRERQPGLLPDELPPGGTGEVVLFVELGYAPMKLSQEADVPIFKNEKDPGDVDAWSRTLGRRYRDGWSSDVKIEYWLRFALPELVDTPPEIVGAHVSTGSIGVTTTVPVEDVAGRAELFDKFVQGKILLKSIARALTKYLAKETADDSGKVAGILMNLLGAATERADTRSWLTLPHDIVMARLSLPPGDYDLRVDLVDAGGRTVERRTIAAVPVRTGDWTFLSRRAFR